MTNLLRRSMLASAAAAICGRSESPAAICDSTYQRRWLFSASGDRSMGFCIVIEGKSGQTAIEIAKHLESSFAEIKDTIPCGFSVAFRDWKLCDVLGGTSVGEMIVVFQVNPGADHCLNPVALRLFRILAKKSKRLRKRLNWI